MFRRFSISVFLSLITLPLTAASEVASAVTQPRLPAVAVESLSRRPAGTTTTVASAASKTAKTAKPAPKPKPPTEPTADIEIWLGEGVGRFGDFEFAVLGGKPGHPTPTGAFQIEWKSRSWWSRQYDAEMPYACFFSGGAAIHEGSLRVKSHGCVHVSKEAAKHIFSRGKEKVTRVIVYP